MPSQKTEEQGDRTPEKPITDSQIPVSKIEPPSSSQEINSSHNRTNRETSHDKPQVIDIGKIPKIDVIEGIEANKIARSANTISKVSTGVNFVLMLCTVILAGYAIIQANSARDAAKIAQKTLDTTRKYDLITLKNQQIADKKADDSSYSKYKREIAVFNAQKNFYTVNKRGVDAQIKSIQETQSEFEIENRPFFQITDIRVDTSQKDHIGGTYLIANEGKQPGKIISARVAAGLSNTTLKYLDEKLQHYTLIEGIYISSAAPNHGIFNSASNAESIALTRQVKNGSGNIYIMGDIIYQSPASNKIHETIFYYRVTISPSFNIETVREEYK